jgi:hypothetical protein
MNRLRKKSGKQFIHNNFKNSKIFRCCWLMLIIRRQRSGGSQPGQIVLKTLSQKYSSKIGLGEWLKW